MDRTSTPRQGRRGTRTLARLLAATSLLAAAPVAALAVAGDAQAAGGHTFYVSPGGSDAASGTSPDQAWSSLSRASRQQLRPGDRLLLARGATFRGTLSLDESGTAASPILVGSYGSGDKPVVTNGGCVQVGGSHVSIDGLTIRSCDWTGVDVRGDHVRLSGSTVSGNISGVKIESSAYGTRVIGNQIVDNNRMAPNTPGNNDDYGAFGVEVLGDHATIARNHISGQHAPSRDYGVDGSAVELYGGKGTSIHHNVSWNNQTFTELGNPRTANTRYAYNVVRSSLANSAFIVTRGTGDYWGAIYGTVARHNSVRLTGAGSQTFWCGSICGPRVLKLYDNILVSAADIGYATAPSSGPYAGKNIGGARNLYYGSVLHTRMLPGDRIANPGFTNLTTLALGAGSPAVDRGDSAGFSRDAEGRSANLDGDGNGKAAPDLGAMELPGR